MDLLKGQQSLGDATQFGTQDCLPSCQGWAQVLAASWQMPNPITTKCGIGQLDTHNTIYRIYTLLHSVICSTL